MGFFATLNKINIRTASAMPTIVAAGIAAEALGPDATGAQKLNAASIGAIQALASSTDINAQSVGAGLEMVVTIANLLRVFTHKTASDSVLAPAKPPVAA